MTVWLSIEETREAIKDYLRKSGLKSVEEIQMFDTDGNPVPVGGVPAECEPIKAVKSVR